MCQRQSHLLGGLRIELLHEFVDVKSESTGELLDLLTVGDFDSWGVGLNCISTGLDFWMCACLR
jgi:hypothetical protein